MAHLLRPRISAVSEGFYDGRGQVYRGKTQTSVLPVELQASRDRNTRNGGIKGGVKICVLLPGKALFCFD